MDIESLKTLVKENREEFATWLADNDWSIETKPKPRFVAPNGIKLPFSLAAGMWAEERKNKK
ncbi:hypothetical protein [Fibrobacter sp.]|uniref:hypothetical protein n=1 Tax=Fibrobacter sp. TaxID=35828 RepID=UPI00388F5001